MRRTILNLLASIVVVFGLALPLSAQETFQPTSGFVVDQADYYACQGVTWRAAILDAPKSQPLSAVSAIPGPGHLATSSGTPGILVGKMGGGNYPQGPYTIVYLELKQVTDDPEGDLSFGCLGPSGEILSMLGQGTKERSWSVGTGASIANDGTSQCHLNVTCSAPYHVHAWVLVGYTVP